jgi:hypothetical protein
VGGFRLGRVSKDKNANERIVMFGGHALKSWSTTEQAIALSSGEAEYDSMVKGGSMGIGINAISGGLGLMFQVHVKTDASAPKGIASRRGLDNVRHIDVSQLWLQDRVNKGDINIENVSTKVNIADALTQFIDSSTLSSHMVAAGLVIRTVRLELKPECEYIVSAFNRLWV